jgi:heme oxygenase
MVELGAMVLIEKITKNVRVKGFYYEEFVKKNTYYIDKNIISKMNDEEINRYNKIMDILYGVGFKFKFAA